VTAEAMTAPSGAAPTTRKRRRRGEMELVTAVIAAAAVVVLARVLLFQPFIIPSASMEPTLQQGDYVVVSTLSYGLSKHSIPFSPPLFSGRLFNRAPARGDIVVFKLPREAGTTGVDYVKRVIGLPGDRIQLKQGLVYINGAPVIRKPAPAGQEDAGGGISVPVSRYWETLPNGRTFLTNSYGDDNPAENTGVYVVPQHCYFTLGDNRDNSLDSRFDPAMPSNLTGSAACGWDAGLDKFIPGDAGVGFVPEEDLVGHAQLILFSAKPGASLFNPKTWGSSLRPNRAFLRLQ
jgi:signal peptidase I